MIFYFSGTGNSKWVAEQLAETLNDKVISIGDAFIKGEFRYQLSDGERIGWVFPIHSWGPPPIVLKFISKWHIDGYKPSTYCYMVCTCGDDIGMSVEMWRKALGGIAGNAAFSIQMPNSYICLPGFDVDSKDIERSKLKTAEKEIKNIAFSIAERRNSVEVVTGKHKWLKSRLIYPLYRKYGLTDKAFTCDKEKCTSCGICETSCPVHNIVITNGYPQWNHHCEMCLSCIHRCPTQAINYGKITMKKGRYHHKG